MFQRSCVITRTLNSCSQEVMGLGCYGPQESSRRSLAESCAGGPHEYTCRTYIQLQQAQLAEAIRKLETALITNHDAAEKAITSADHSMPEMTAADERQQEIESIHRLYKENMKKLIEADYRVIDQQQIITS